MVARHLLGQRAAVVLKHDEVAHQRQKAARLKDALQHHLQLGQVRISQRLPGDRAPGLEPLPAAGERSDAGLDSVRNHQRLIHGEQRGQLGFVGLELIPRRSDSRVLVRRVLQLDHAQRQAVDEQQHVRPACVSVFGHAELVNRQPVVVGRGLKVDNPDLIAAHPPLCIAILDLDAAHEHPVKGAVARFQDRTLRPRQPAVGIINRIDGQTGIEHGERVPQPALQYDLAVVGTLGFRRVGRNVWSVGHLPAEAGKPLKRGLFNVGFAEGCHGMLRVTPTSSVHPSVQGLDPRILAQYQAKGP